jgi:hypothetical protein
VNGWSAERGNARSVLRTHAPEPAACLDLLVEAAPVPSPVLDVMRNGANKIAVALGADDPHVEEGIEVYEVDADGVAHYGLDPADL